MSFIAGRKYVSINEMARTGAQHTIKMYVFEYSKIAWRA
jgi:hypothetical protein